MSSGRLFRILNLTSIVFTILLACSLSQAKDAKELAIRPGDTLRFEVKFEGPDAGKITQITLFLRSKTGEPADQVGFGEVVQSPPFKPLSLNTFQAEIKITDNIATGDYVLQIGAEAVQGGVSYDAGKQFQLHSFHIDNSRKFTPPKITVKEQ